MDGLKEIVESRNTISRQQIKINNYRKVLSNLTRTHINDKKRITEFSEFIKMLLIEERTTLNEVKKFIEPHHLYGESEW